MTIRPLHLLFVGVVLSCTGLQYSAPAWSKTETVCGAPLAADDGWQTASTDQVGFDAALLCSLNMNAVGPSGSRPENLLNRTDFSPTHRDAGMWSIDMR